MYGNSQLFRCILYKSNGCGQHYGPNSDTDEREQLLAMFSNERTSSSFPGSACGAGKLGFLLQWPMRSHNIKGGKM